MEVNISSKRGAEFIIPDLVYLGRNDVIWGGPMGGEGLIIQKDLGLTCRPFLVR